MPNPRISHSKNAGPGNLTLMNFANFVYFLGIVYHYLTWEGTDGGEWMDSSVFNMEVAESTEISAVSACNTRKVAIYSFPLLTFMY